MGISSHGSGGFLDLGSFVYMNRSRGTAASPTALQSGDYIGGMLMGGYGQGDYQLGITGLLGIATDDWDTNPGYMTINWMMGSTSCFNTDQTLKTTVTQPFNFQSTVQLPTQTPSSATDTGIVGQIAWDTSYIYICVATNTWKRTAISTW